MPNWKTHLEVGRKLRKICDYNDKEYNLFLMGNILPDLNNGYMLQEISEKIGHETTHFVIEGNPSYENFYSKYKNEIKKSPLLMGCFTHLFVDWNFNNNFYTTYRDENLGKYSRDELRMMKQHDFRIFNNNFLDNMIDLDYFEEVVKESKKIEELSLTVKDIKDAVDFSKMKIWYEGKYNFYSEEELEKLLGETLNKLTERIKKIKEED